MKKVLVLCTGNSCRSIIAEAQINAFLEGVEASSAGVRANGTVNPYAQKVLEEKGIWKPTYYSKTVGVLLDRKFDLVITVCDHAKETCPMVYFEAMPHMHISFEDPDGQDYAAFERCYEEIYNELLPQVKENV